MSTATTNTSILRSAGSVIGKSAAYAVHGTRLASTQLAIGAAEGYAAKAAELRAQRLAILGSGPALAVPTLPVKQKRVAA